ncbi:MAG: MATE family efflux transporter [Bacilli bacterium]|nr:MATE family efflux transporter [Bacilli bacterium]
MKNEKIYLTEAPIKKLLMKFSIPCILSLLISALYNIVDQIFIGNSLSGTAGIMATTIVFPFTVVALSIALMVGDGASALFSISMGGKEKEVSQKCIGNSLTLMIIFKLLLTIIGFIFQTPILNVLGINGYSLDCRLYAKTYYTIILMGFPFYIFTAYLSSLIRADGSPIYAMIATVVGAVINLIFDPILIFVFNMGVRGAAIATIAGQIISALISIIYFKKPKLMNITKDTLKLDKHISKKILQLGISSFITQISIAIITVVANNVVGTIGGNHATDAGGALGIVFKVFAIVISFSIGVSVGGQPIIGFNYGAKRYDRVIETYKKILFVNIIIGLIVTILFQFFPKQIVSLFGGNASDFIFYQNYAVKAFRLYLGGILFCCIQKSSCIFLQSIDKPYKSMILSLTRDVILLVPGVLIFGLLGNLDTMLYAGIIADIGSFIITVIFISIEYNNIKDYKVVDTKKNNSSHFVITIGREFGSGGKYIGECLAKKFNINCYDKELLELTAKDYNLDLKTLENVDEQEKNTFWYGFASKYLDSKNEVLPISAKDALFLKISKVIEDLYHKEDCIIIGRCSNYILKDYDNVFKIFIYASDMDFKIERKEKFNNLTKKEAIKEINKIDKLRKNHYEYFTGVAWKDINNYDLCIDTSSVGIDDAINIIESYVKNKIN